MIEATLPVHRFSPEQYARRLAIANKLAIQDWSGRLEFPTWKNRYANLLTGLSKRKVREFHDATRDERIRIINRVMAMGANLDSLNLRKIEL